MARWLNFFSKVAFVCNLFFVVSAVLQWRTFISSQSLVSTIVVMGYFLAVFVFNPLVNVWYGALLLQKKKWPEAVPQWLAFSNFIFLLLQVVFIIFFLNDTFYY